jgi:hypothetical protein
MLNNKGSSLLESMVALAVLGVTIAAVSQYFGAASGASRKDRGRYVQAKIAETIKSNLRSPSQLYYTLTRFDMNPTLSGCFLGILRDGTSVDCRSAQDPSRPKAFGLFQVTNADATSGKLLTNSETGKRVVYDLNGSICDSDRVKRDDTCAFEVKTYFFLQCDDADANCRTGSTQLSITYQVTQIAGKLKKLGSPLPPYPKTYIYSTLSAREIMGPQINGRCGGDKGIKNNPGDDFVINFADPTLATVVGYDVRGNPICKCLFPYLRYEDVFDKATGTVVPKCRLLTDLELNCANGSETQFLRGFSQEENDKSAICVDAQHAYDCKPYGPTKICDGDSWLTTVQRADCNFECAYIPDGEKQCELHMIYPIPPVPDITDKKAYTDLLCSTGTSYCCTPTRYR